MPGNIEGTFELLFDKDNGTAYKALQELQRESERTDCLRPYLDRLGGMLGSDNSYIRTRGLVLLACYAKWDKGHELDGIIPSYLEHVTDAKPITARQCIKMLPMLAQHKLELKDEILSALCKADVSFYGGSMGPLVYKDIQKVIKEIQKL